MNKEKIKEKCAEIEKILYKGATPQEIAHICNGKISYHDTTQELIDGYEEYLIDFNVDGCEFGITLWSDDDYKPDWRWENEDEIWLFAIQDFAYWKSL